MYSIGATHTHPQLGGRIGDRTNPWQVSSQYSRGCYWAMTSLLYGASSFPQVSSSLDICYCSDTSPSLSLRILGVCFIFCTKLCCRTSSGRKTSEIGFAPGVPRIRMSRWLLLECPSRRRGSSSTREMRQPMHSYSPRDEEPKGSVKLLLALCLPTLCA